MDDYSDDQIKRLVLEFLRDFKELMGNGCYLIKDHLKNLQALKELMITARVRDDTILALILEDYASGPHMDELKPGVYWVFGKNVGDIEIYIKLKIVTYNNGKERAICISFHPSEYPLNYLFRSNQ